MDRTNEPNRTGYLVCGRGREDQPMYFATADALTAWVNENPMVRAYCEYIELTNEHVKNMIMSKGFTTYTFRVWSK